MGCDLVRYENKVETIVGMHSQNLLGENNLEGVQKPSEKGHLQINVGCVRMPTWKGQMKIRGPGLVCNFLGKVGGSHLIEDVKQKELKWCQKMWV